MICFYFGRDNNTLGKAKYISEDEALISCPDQSDGCTLMTASRDGGKREVDVSCDSHCMKDVIEKVVEAICDTYYRVDQDHLKFLYLDNAGGHGTQSVVDQ